MASLRHEEAFGREAARELVGAGGDAPQAVLYGGCSRHRGL